MNNFDFSISNEEETNLVGNIKYYSGECIEYFTEEKMLNDFKNTLYTMSFYGIDYYNIFLKGNTERHGLKYEFEKAKMDEFGLDYTKEDYIANYKKTRDNLDIELV